MREVETSTGEGRSLGTFPAEWGMPPGSQFSEERAAWVRERVREHRSLTLMRRRAAEVKRASTDRVARERRLLLARREP